MVTIQNAVKQHEADLGIALDGDADRVLMVDKEGVIYDGDVLLYIIAKHRQQNKFLKGGVVGTLMTNLAVEKAFNELGIPFLRAKVGDRYVLELLLENNWQLGGESSGHIVCLDKHTTGDGIISALQVLYALRDRCMSLAEYTQEVVLYPQRLINVITHNNFDFHNNPSVKNSVAQAERDLGNEGRILLRASGTEPLIRVMVEGKVKQKVDYWAEQIADTVRQGADAH